MGRNKLNEEKKKSRFSVTINSELVKLVNETIDNKSKYLEWLVYQDLKKNNKIDNDFML